MQTANRPEQLDIGLILSAPAKDPQWVTKCLVMGLLTLIPILGGLNMSGWTKAIADRHADGDTTLPPANLSYIGAGWRVFLAWLPLMLVIVGGMGTLGGAAVALVMTAGEGGGGAVEHVLMVLILTMSAGIFVVSGLAAIVGPAVNFLHIVDGERFPSIAFKRQWELMKEGGTQYVLLFVAVLLAGLIAQLGIFLLFVGIFVTAPYAQAMQGIALAEYARVLRPKAPSFKVDGGVGGASGTPFGVTL